MESPYGGGDGGPTTGNLQAQIDQLRALLNAGTIGGMQISSVQSGVITINADTSASVIITAVGSKAVLMPLGYQCNTNNVSQSAMRLEIVPPTTVNGYKTSASGVSSMGFMVIDYV